MVLKEGFHIFRSSSRDLHGYELASSALQNMVREAQKEFDIEFIGGLVMKDDPGERCVVFAAIASILHKKTE